MLKRAKLFLLIIILNFTLQFIYNFSIYPQNTYMGYVAIDNSFFEQISVLTFVLLPTLYLPLNINFPSNVIIWMMYLFSYLPTAIIGLQFLDSTTDYLCLLLILNLAVITFLWASSLNLKINTNRMFNLYGLDKAILLFVIGFTVFFIWSLINFQFNLNFLDIYERRMDAREVQLGLMAYFMSFLRNAFLALSVYLLIFKKIAIYFILVIFGLGGIFIFDGTKTAIILPLVSLGYAIFLRNGYVKSPLLFVGISISVILMGIIESSFSTTSLISEYLIRRIFVVPGILNCYYFDSFNQDVFGFYISGDYGKTFNTFKMPDLGYYVGYNYLGKLSASYLSSNANTGIWLNGFAQFGIFGVIIVSILSGLVSNIINFLSKKSFHYYGSIVAIITGIIWSEQALQTSMLTGGVFISILILLHLNYSKDLNQKWGLFKDRQSSRMFK